MAGSSGQAAIMASHCGLLGHKPTVGRAARADGFPVILHEFEVVGPIARSLADLDAMMAILAGPDVADPQSSRWPEWRAVDRAPSVILTGFASRARRPCAKDSTKGLICTRS